MKISVVIISYNQGEFLEETILSVVNQDYDDKEIILIDGGSSDSSVEIIKKYNNDLTYWISEKDKGQSDAISKGFSKCTGEIITWINSDDVLCNNALESVAKTAKKMNNTDAVFYGNSIIIDESSNIQEKYCYGSFIYSIAKVLGPTITQPGTFFGKNIYFNCGGIDLELHYGMDLDLFCNFLFSNIPFYYTGQYMAKFRKYSNQKGHSEIFLRICEIESKQIMSRYGIDTISKTSKNIARIKQIFVRIFNGYYLSVLTYRLIFRGRIFSFNPTYSN